MRAVIRLPLLQTQAFCADPSSDIFEARGIDRERGCLVVVVRRDQYVAEVLPLDGWDALAAYFGGAIVALT